MPRRTGQWHLTGWRAIVLAPILIPAAFVARAVTHVFGLKDTIDRSAHEVAGFIDDFLGERGGEWDWDDFTSIPITDPALDVIRDEAARIPLPLDANGRAELTRLLAKARS